MTTVDPRIALLSRPLDVAGFRLPGRTVMAPMSRYLAHSGRLPAAAAEYYRQRAAGGVGLIVTEGTAIPFPYSDYKASVPSISEETAATWAAVVDAVHGAGARILLQLWHPGLMRLSQQGEGEAAAFGPAAIMPGVSHAGRALAQRDIDALVDAYANASETAQRLGFDGVNIHGAHGYLIDEFMWSRTNPRRDRYGGPTVNRVRLAADIVAEIRRRCGAGFAIMFRFSQWKSTDYAARIAESPHELEAFLLPLAAAGVDVFDASTRRFWLPEFTGSYLNLAGWAKKITGRLSASVGSVTLTEPRREGAGAAETIPQVTDNLRDLLDRLEREEFDLVSIGRALIANPDWPRRIVAGGVASLKPYDPAMLSVLE